MFLVQYTSSVGLLEYRNVGDHFLPTLTSLFLFVLQIISGLGSCSPAAVEALSSSLEVLQYFKTHSVSSAVFRICHAALFLFIKKAI